MVALSEYAKQLGAFSILVVVQSFAILLFKLCQKDGRYTFNPASSVALTEVCKLVLASTLHWRPSPQCSARGPTTPTPTGPPQQPDVMLPHPGLEPPQSVVQTSTAMPLAGDAPAH